MFKNYLKTASRFLKENKVFAGINALGLSIALAASFIILLFVINELSYDSCHKNKKSVFRVINYYEEFNNTMSGTPYILAKALKDEFPQIKNAVRTKYMRGFKLKLKDELINVPEVMATDSDIFDIFTLPLILGSPEKNLLENRSSIVLSRDISDKFFPGQNPVGKEVSGIANNEEHIFIVTGVIENIPLNSTFRANCLVNSRWTLDPVNKIFNITNAETSWDKDFWMTWIRLSSDTKPEFIEKQFKAFEIKYIYDKPVNHYSLQNLSDVYLHSDEVMNSYIQGNIRNIRLFSAIAFLIVLVAAINYIILSTAVSTARAKEIGIRKTFGAANMSVRNQLLTESVLLAILVMPLSLVLMRLALPVAGKLFQTQLQIINSNILIYISVYLVLTVLIGIASGIYTSSYLSGLKVLDILKNITKSGKKKILLRSSLIVIQLIIFCTFVSATLIIRSQYMFALKKDLGYYNRNILMVDLGRDFKGYSAYINSIKSNPNIIMAAGVMDPLPMEGSSSFMVPNYQNKEVKVKVEGFAVDYNLLKTIGITLLQGRDFSEEFGSDLSKSCILNETAVKRLGIVDPIGKTFADKTIIGIVKDFNLHTIHSDIPPLMIDMTDRFIEQVIVHYKPETLKSILPLLESEWKKAAPDRPFRYTTIEELIRELYSSEKNLTTIVSIFALFTLLIATFGLFGLTLFVTRSRTKEIGIKKVFGSSEQLIVYSFLRGNLILILTASLLSVPVCLYFMNKWLSNFSYKVSINWWFFVIAFFVAGFVVLQTVYIQSYKASRINPADALRNE